MTIIPLETGLDRQLFGGRPGESEAEATVRRVVAAEVLAELEAEGNTELVTLGRALLSRAPVSLTSYRNRRAAAAAVRSAA